MFKKFISILLSFILALNFTGCTSKKTVNSSNKVKSSQENKYKDCEAIDFSNVEYEDYGDFFGTTFDYPTFLENTSPQDDDSIVKFSTKDNSCSMSVEYKGFAYNFKSIYEKDLANSDNVGFTVFEDNEYRISGDDNETVYYKCSIIYEGIGGYYLQNLLITYPKMYEKEFDPIVTRVYKSFVKCAGADDNIEKERQRLNLQRPDGKDKIISISTYDEITNLGDYDKNKNYDIKYCSVIGKDVYSTDSTFTNFGYNKLNLYGCTLNYPDFLRFSSVPDAKYGITFDDYLGHRVASLNVISTFNLNPEAYKNAKEFVKYQDENYGSFSGKREIVGNYVYSVDSITQSNNYISLSMDYVDDDEEDHVTFLISPELYNMNKEIFSDIFEVMKKSFNHEDNFEVQDEDGYEF